VAGFWLQRKTRSWSYWSPTAHRAGRRIVRQRQTFEVNKMYWRCRQMAQLSILDLSRRAYHRFVLICVSASLFPSHPRIIGRSEQGTPELPSKGGVIDIHRPSMASQSS
jgi:hypothetical protein